MSQREAAPSPSSSSGSTPGSKPFEARAARQHAGAPEESESGRQRVVIEGVTPEIEAGRHPIKRVLGEQVVVEADLFADGHDVLSAVLLYRPARAPDWLETPMRPFENDRWRAAFVVEALGVTTYSIEAWVDHFKSWRRDTQKKRKAGQEIAVELQAGAQLIAQAASRASREDAAVLEGWAATIRGDASTEVDRAALALGDEVAALMTRYPDRRLATRYARELEVIVDPVVARFGAWYEMFPRSCPGRTKEHGTFRDVERQLARIAELGFDILYLPPIHPIGRAFRKGRNNRPEAQPGDVGSPWAIGSAEGGHKSIHPELGTEADFVRLVEKARELRIEIAMDLAYQCSPDHPYVREHPEWFRHRPDGTIQYAENPPKKYQDIYPIDFESEDWRALWAELKSIITHWIGRGVKVFRVDNPHTKAFPFWEWALREVKSEHPEVIFLSEAFTRPKVMYRLAKIGFTQSYNYFPWRNTKQELTGYFEELARSGVREYFRPNLWPNTPDILPQYLQYGGRAAFIVRLVLAGTLGASYGIYGPAYELCEHEAREPGSEEYLDSEKYEVRTWNLEKPGNLSDLMGHLNRIRRANPALQTDERLVFHATDNEQLIAYSKHTEDLSNVVLTVVNLDPHHTQRGWVTLSPSDPGLDPGRPCQVHDLLSGARYLWSGPRNYVELDPSFAPAHIFRLRHRVRTEHDFDYYL